jgi:ATP-dependent Clp protease, protease subunit
MAKKPDFSSWFDYGIDIDSRTIYLGSPSKDGEIDSRSAEQVVKGLMALNWRTDEDITLIINSPGGNVDHRNAIFDAIKSSKADVVGLVLGHAMSAAATIFQACDRRLMAANATLMFHNASWSLNNDVKNIKVWAAEAAKLEQWDEALLLERMRQVNPAVTAKQVKAHMAQDWVMSASEAVDVGLADAIMEAR